MIMLLVMAFLDMLGVASIMPFMAVLMNPEIVETNSFLNTLFNFLGIIGIDNNREFLFALGIGVFILLFLSLFFKALTTYAQMRFTYMREYALCKRLVKGIYISLMIGFNQNSADLGKTVLSEVDQVISKGLNTMMNLIAHSLVTLSIIILLIFIDPLLAIIVGTTLGISYSLIYKFTKSTLKRTGEERMEANKCFTALSEAFGAIKEIKVGDLKMNILRDFLIQLKIMELVNYHLKSLHSFRVLH